MMKLKYVSITVILTMMLGLLAACGGDNATATPIPPTATVPPPTAVPTDTAVPAPTNTTTAMMGATPMATTGTTGGMMGGGMTATAGDVALIQQAVTATQELKSYHFTMQVSGEVFTQPVQLEGDYVAPDKLYIKGTAEGKAIEEVVTGGKVYQKDSTGKWVEPPATPTPDASGAGGASGLGGDMGGMMSGLVPGTDPSQLAQDPNIIKSLAPLLGSVGGFSDTQQDETLDGVSTKHFTFKMDAASMMRAQGGADQLPPNMQNMSFGGGGFWIDPNTKYLHKLDLTIDFAGLMKFMFDALSAGFGGTATPGDAQTTPTPAVNINISVLITKHNDPSITIPSVP